MRALIDTSGLSESDLITWRGFLAGIASAARAGQPLQINGNVSVVLNRFLCPQAKALTGVVGSGTATMLLGWLSILPRAAEAMSAVAIPDHLVQLLVGILPEREPVSN